VTATGHEAAGGLRYDEIGGYFDRFAAEEDRWLRRTHGYHVTLAAITRSLIPRGRRVLEIGCGRGDLLASLEPSQGVGVDVSPGMLEAARRRHPELELHCVAGEELDLEQFFDYILLSDLVPYVDDLQRLFERVQAHSHARTRVVISTYSNAWRPLLALAAGLGLRPRRPVRNWVAPRDLTNLAELAGLEVVSERRELLVPTTSRVVSRLANGILVRLPLVRELALTYWLVARPAPVPEDRPTVSVVVPCRNEAGSIRDIVERVPEMGRATEIVFVENDSTDGTRERIEEEIARCPERDIRLIVRPAAGKWNAVQEGFNAATNELLMILDGDITVAPEELPKFYDALASGRGELINGSRLVYAVEPGAMRFLNLAGNKLFAALMSRVLGQYVKDTLCGTKALHRDDWARIRALRGELGPDDPFGDYHLLIGASLLGLRILNVPVRYGARFYGQSNMDRFSYGGTLTRITTAAFLRIWVRPPLP